MANGTSVPCALCGVAPGVVSVWKDRGYGRKIVTLACVRCSGQDGDPK